MFTKHDILHIIATLAESISESEGLHDTDVSIERWNIAKELFIAPRMLVEFRNEVARHLRILRDDGFVILTRTHVKITN